MTRTGIKIDLDVGDLLSNAGRARGAISALNEAMRKAEKEKRFEDYGKLAYEKERLQGRANVFDQDVRKFANNPKFSGIGANGQPVFKVDQEYASLIKAQTEAMKRLTAEYEATIAKGDIDSAMAISPQIAKQQKDFHKITEQTFGMGAKSNGVGEAVKSIAMNQIAGAIKSGLDVWVGSLDRTAVINSVGSGDVLGASLAESQRRASRTKGALDTTGAAAQGIGMALAPFTGGVSLIAGTGANLLTKGLSSLSEADQIKYANKIAYSSLWDERKDQAMNLAALKGSPDKVREAFNTAAAAAEKFGYSAEEGMELYKNAIQHGLNGSTIQEIFKYERSTGADRGALSSLANMSARYGNGDALGAAWVGLQATGMKTGQFSENLRAFERVISDGIQKGFIKSSEEVVKNFMMFAEMTKNNPLWQGEQGAKRLLEMNAGLEQATGLQSASDIMAYRAMRNIMPSTEDYVDVMAAMEQGVTPDFFREYMSLTSDAEGGDRNAIIERMKQTFGLNYTNARTLFEGRDKFGSMSTEEFQKMMTDLKGLPNSDSAELRSSVETMQVRNLIIESGQKSWDTEYKNSLNELKRQYTEATGGILPGSIKPAKDMSTTIGIPNASSIYEATGYIKTHSSMVIPDYFSGRDEKKERDKFGSLLDRASSGSELQAGYNAMQLLDSLPKSVRERWDSENTLNPIVNNNNTLEQIFRAITRLIEIEEKNSDIKIEIN